MRWIFNRIRQTSTWRLCNETSISRDCDCISGTCSNMMTSNIFFDVVSPYIIFGAFLPWFHPSWMEAIFPSLGLHLIWRNGVNLDVALEVRCFENLRRPNFEISRGSNPVCLRSLLTCILETEQLGCENDIPEECPCVHCSDVEVVVVATAWAVQVD